MPVTRRLSEVIEETISTLESQGLAPASIKSARQTYDHFLGMVGNIQLKYLDTTKIDEFFLSRQQKGETYNTLNLRRNWIRKLVEVAKLRRYMSHDPVAHVRSFRGMERKHLLIPASDFGRLLDCAEHPEDRCAVALGLYQFNRIGETVGLRVGDVDLNGRTIHKTNFKLKERDQMPISIELDIELRRWLAHYSAEMGELHPNWYLLPRRAGTIPRRQPDGTYLHLYAGGHAYRPDRIYLNPHRLVQRPLEAAGYEMRDENDKSKREGGHTLRRSGARALYDRLRTDGSGHDDANRTVQSMLGHKSFSTTERYLGLDVDRSKRNTLIAGHMMFPPATNADNVVELRR